MMAAPRYPPGRTLPGALNTMSENGESRQKPEMNKYNERVAPVSAANAIPGMGPDDYASSAIHCDALFVDSFPQMSMEMPFANDLPPYSIDMTARYETEQPRIGSFLFDTMSTNFTCHHFDLIGTMPQDQVGTAMDGVNVAWPPSQFDVSQSFRVHNKPTYSIQEEEKNKRIQIF